jgi:uncharacterized phage-associated protein
MSHSSLAVANKILQIAWQKKKSLTIMQLIKLVYISHGWSLALLNRPLVSDRVEAWQHGPVYPEIYNEFRGSGWQPIMRTAKDALSGVAADSDFDDDDHSIMEKVVESYGNFHAFELSARTHQPGTPWFDTYDGGEGKFAVIRNDLIKTHFDELKGS